MKILIAVDIEGIAGIANAREYEHFQFGREWCTLDTNAAVEGALAGGATEITVSDTHGRHNDNISFDLLHPKARLIRGGKNTPLYFMEGLTEDTNLVLLVGWHDKIGGPGVLSHTFVHKEINAMRINGVEVGEVEIAAGVAATSAFRLDSSLVMTLPAKQQTISLAISNRLLSNTPSTGMPPTACHWKQPAI